MSMSMYALPEGLVTFDEMTAGEWLDDGTFIPNPAYVEEADVSFSNSNTHAIVNLLGLRPVEEGHFECGVNELIHACMAYMHDNHDAFYTPRIAAVLAFAAFAKGRSATDIYMA